MSFRQRWPRTFASVAARAWIRAAALLVPTPRRPEWIEEWESELWYLLDTPSEGRPRSPFSFCCGVLPHALFERRAAELPARLRSGFSGSLLQDVRYALRSFRRSPSFVVIAVTTLAIGIGATTVIFSVVDAVLLRPLPYRDPSRLVVLGTVYENFRDFRGLTSTSAPNFLDWRERTRSFEAMAGIRNTESIVLYGEEPERVRIVHVSSELFGILGISPAIGRTFGSDEYRLGSEAVAILSHGLWQRRFGGDEAVIGRTIDDADTTFTVVGVMPAELEPPEALWVRRADLWMPVDFRDPDFAERTRRIMRVVGRLKPGVAIEAAREEVDALATALIEEHPDELTFRGTESRIGVEEIYRETVGDVGDRLMVLLGAVCFLLLIACANVANLTLARGAARSREMALRSALGAGRGRLLRQLATESLLIALAAGTAGVGLAFLGVKLFAVYEPGDIPRLSEVVLDFRVLMFSLLVSIATGVVFSLAPLLQHADRRLGEALKDGARGSLGGGGVFQKSLVITETALALTLLIGAGLLMNSFVRLNQVDPGFSPENVFAAPIRFGPDYTMAERDRFVREMIERVGRLAGVRAVSAGMNLPIGDVNWRTNTFAEGAEDSAGQEDLPPANIHMAYPGYVDTIGMRLLEGRDFTFRDRAGQVEVGIVNESLAKLHWPEHEGEVVGRRLRIGFEPEAPWITVVGVINDVRQAGLASAPIPELYRPYPQGQVDWMDQLTIVARHDEGVSLAPLVRREVHSMDPKMALSGFGSLEERIFRSIRVPRFYSSLLTAFALVALLLAAGGIYGTVLYSVGQRKREVGIRIALGARAKEVSRMVVWQAMVPVGLGLLLGLVGAVTTTRLLESFLFGVTRGDVPTFAAVASALGIVGWAACLSPARRAARTDPVTTLRAE